MINVNNCSNCKYHCSSVCSLISVLGAFNENEGIRTSNKLLSTRSITNTPLYKYITWQSRDNSSGERTYHMFPDGQSRDTWLEYWKQGCVVEKTGSSPTTPWPLTVSNLPDVECIRHCLFLSISLSPLRHSSRIVYLYKATPNDHAHWPHSPPPVLHGTFLIFITAQEEW